MKHPKTTIQFIAAIKATHGVTSDYAVSKLLRVSRQTVSQYQLGKRFFDVRTCFRAAELLNDQPAAVIAAVELERAEAMGAEPEEAEEWKGWVKKLGGAAASILLAAGLGGIPNGDTNLARSQSASNLYIVSNKGKKKARWFDGLMGLGFAF